MNHLTEDDLVLHYYGELDAAAEGAANAHLAACAGCQGSYTKLQRVMAAIDSAPAVEPADGFERTTWARLEMSLPARQAGWLSWLVPSPARLAWAAGVAVLVIAAFAAGRFATNRAPAPAPQAVANQVRERILLVDLGEHLDRSQMVLVELVSEDAGTPAEQQRAQQLLSANRLYRQAALQTGDTATAAVLDDLERVLVDVAASGGTMSQEDFDQVRRRIESDGLLFKVRVVSSNVRQKLQGKGI